VAKRANIYIDGFNLYYGALKGTPYKWLDLEALGRKLIPEYDIGHIRYFTARAAGRPDNPHAPNRQETYLRALMINPMISIHFGRFQETRVRMALADPPAKGPRTVEVLKTEEKGTDVNLATYLLYDVFPGSCDLSVVISNDADLAEPLRVLTTELGSSIGLVNPGRAKFRCRDLAMLDALFFRQIKEKTLAASQLPEVLRDASGIIRCPYRWLPKTTAPPR
jgi:hypothetical protein